MIDNPCEWGSAALLIFSENVGKLIYYTHVLPLVISLFLGFQVLISNPKELANRVLFVTTVLFATWVYFNLILWASPTPEMVVFFWSLIVPVELLMYLSAVYLVYLFSNRQVDMPTWMKVCFSLLLVPILLFAHTSLNVIGLSPDCDTGAFEGIVIQYMYFVEVFLLFIVVLFIIKGLSRIEKKTERRQLLFIGISTFIFLAFFTAGNFTLFFDLGPYYEQYKLFGMPLFAGLVSYSIIKYRAFHTKTLFTEILISALWILMFSMLLFRDMSYARPIIFITVIIFGFLGIILSRVMRRELEQKAEIERLAVGLEKANERLQILDKQKSEFVSIASHQLRSPLTAIRGYVSMMTEGSFGKLPDKANEALGRIAESTVFMASSIDDFLEVSRIESGNMKYDYKDMNFKEQAEHVVDDLRADAVRRGLLLMFRSDMTGTGMVHADAGKTQQILHNLINNALKYTPKGSVTVYAHDDVKTKKMYVDIIDTGLGLSPESLQKLFGKFARAKVASSANIMGTGLGLFVAREMARAMGGDITVTSDGEGLGSTFTITLPLI
ncbi:HAMP domain-containing histidine kinase [Patescibacteria group bacterium]|nr:HAMP domain-containing histidine kinase [Patescibacteria group bacterium]